MVYQPFPELGNLLLECRDWRERHVTLLARAMLV